jgi:predicted ATP-grasp superfamily ATP-dependent carboligase
MGSRIPAIVLGSGVTGLGAVRALAAAGIKSYVLADDPGPVRWSRWYRAAPGRESAARTDLPAYLAALPWPRAVLIPCSDHWTLAVANLPATLRDRFPASIPAADVLGSIVDKLGLAGIMQRLGVPHPRTVDLSRIADLEHVPGDLLARSFLKPRDSQRFFAEYGVKAFLVRARTDALQRLQILEAAGHRMVLQEFVPGGADHHYFVDGFAPATGEPSAVFVRRRLRMYPRSFGNSSYMVSVEPREAGPAIAHLFRLLEHVRYRGPFSAEFKRDANDDVLKLLEINVRPWWYVEFAARCGVNVCAMAYHDALGEAVAPVWQYDVGQGCVYTSYDVHACLAARRRGELTWREWARSWRTAMRPIFRFDDPVPGFVGAISYAFRRGRRALVPSVALPPEWQPDTTPAS